MVRRIVILSLLLVHSMNTTALTTQTAATHAPAIEWQRILDSHKLIILPQVYKLIQAQQRAFSAQQLPKISDPCIKEIPIVHSDEALVDITTCAYPRIHMLPNPEKPFAAPTCNAGFAGSSKIRKGVFVRLEAMIEYLDFYAPIFGYKVGSISIKVFEGLRDVTTQSVLFNNKVQEIRLANPAMCEEDVISEASKWISPVHNNIPVHSTGGAIDIVLWDNQKQAIIDMGMFGVIWGKNDTAPTFSEQVTQSQKMNRLLMLLAATSAGLTNYPWEFWHFSYGDRYASYWLEDKPENRKALYGAVS